MRPVSGGAINGLCVALVADDVSSPGSITVTDGAADLTLRFQLLALLLTLLIAVSKRASDSPIRNALGVCVLFAGFFSFCALLAEALMDVTLYAVPVGGIAVVALLWWVIEPKITPRLRPLLPHRRTVQ